MAFPFTTHAGLTTTLGGSPDTSRPDRTISVSQPAENITSSASATGRWSFSATTTVRLNAQAQLGGAPLQASNMRWAIIARRVR